MSITFNDTINAGAASKSTQALMVTDATSYKEALNNCAAVHESLFNIEHISPSFNLSATIGHLVYDQPLSTTQKYWVDSAQGPCHATNSAGEISTVSCFEQLPALCTQNAP